MVNKVNRNPEKPAGKNEDTQIVFTFLSKEKLQEAPYHNRNMDD